MDGTLIDLPPSHESWRPASRWEQLAAELALLRREMSELRRENAELRRENAEFRQQVGYWKSRHADAVQRLAKLEAEAE